MDKKAKIGALAALVIAILAVSIFVVAAPRAKRACGDSIDNDRDGLTDYPNDPGCSSATDTTETSTSLVCDNGADAANDRDTLADYRLTNGDPGCTSATDPSEIDGVCDDKVDDASDADTLADGSDPGCTSFSDTSEIDGQCDDLADNDNDTYIDYPNDPGCTSYSDSSELGTAQCDDGIDNNDRDTLVDYPDDAGCSSPSDNTEIDGVCDDKVDDVSDTDYLADGSDPGCTSFSDTSEIDGQCDDKIDNDGDGNTDYYNSYNYGDSKCSSYSDDDESPKDSCSESDWWGQVTNQGNTTGYDESVPYSYTDYCIDGTTLKEYYCGNKTIDYAPLNMDFNCNNGNQTICSNGACV